MKPILMAMGRSITMVSGKQYFQTLLLNTMFFLEFVKVFELEFAICLLQIKLGFSDDVVQVTSISKIIHAIHIFLLNFQCRWIRT